MDRIKEIAKRTDDNLRDFDEIYARKFNLEDAEFDTMIEKLAILTHMFSLEFSHFLKSGNTEVMEHMWDGRYSE